MVLRDNLYFLQRIALMYIPRHNEKIAANIDHCNSTNLRVHKRRESHGVPYGQLCTQQLVGDICSDRVENQAGAPRVGL